MLSFDAGTKRSHPVLGQQRRHRIPQRSGISFNLEATNENSSRDVLGSDHKPLLDMNRYNAYNTVVDAIRMNHAVVQCSGLFVHSKTAQFRFFILLIVTLTR